MASMWHFFKGGKLVMLSSTEAGRDFADVYDCARGNADPLDAVTPPLASLEHVSAVVPLSDGRLLVFGHSETRLFDPATETVQTA